MTILGPFLVVEIDGRPILPSSEPSIELSDDGRVHGHAVNRFSGTVEQSAGSITFGAIAATRMAGPPDLMAQEDAILRVLQGTATLSRADGDHVLLTSSAGSLTLVPPVSDGAIDDASTGLEQL